MREGRRESRELQGLPGRWQEGREQPCTSSSLTLYRGEARCKEGGREGLEQWREREEGGGVWA